MSRQDGRGFFFPFLFYITDGGWFEGFGDEGFVCEGGACVHVFSSKLDICPTCLTTYQENTIDQSHFIHLQVTSYLVCAQNEGMKIL